MSKERAEVGVGPVLADTHWSGSDAAKGNA